MHLLYISMYFNIFESVLVYLNIFEWISHVLFEYIYIYSTYRYIYSLFECM
jgi:hypothetical protein